MKIYYENEEYVAEKNQTVLDCLREHDVPISADCNGEGKCGKCRVCICKGETSAITSTEKNMLSEQEIQQGIRLACETYPVTDLYVQKLSEQNTQNRKAGMNKGSVLPIGESDIQKICITVSPASLEWLASDEERLIQEIEKRTSISEVIVSFSALVALGNMDMSKEQKLTVTLRKNEVIFIQEGDHEKDCYGIAVDIGTTSLVVILWNLKEGHYVDAQAMPNPQGTYGADVISRIQYCMEKEENLLRLQQMIHQGINDLVQKLTLENHVYSEDICSCCVVGNTTMTHLFLGISPNRIALAPFSPVFTKGQSVLAKDLGINICPQAKVEVLPNIAGHVGADITAGILATSLEKIPGVSILIDVGTNGEIVLNGEGNLAVCSTAAGPAFEGASIQCGMRAQRGAIERFQITDHEIVLGVIGDEIPKGICGSGLIDIVAELLRCGVITNKGKLLNKEEAEQNNLPDFLAARLQNCGKVKQFVLYQAEAENENVVITQKDIREVQLAKAAIYGGMECMLAHKGYEIKDIHSFLIAGAFGAYINVENAIQIGLFPKKMEQVVRFVGNTAGDGAGMALLSKLQSEKISKLVTNIEHIELSNDKEFQMMYMKAMNF